MKNNKKLLIIAFVLTIAVILGTTYAWIRISKESEIINRIKVGDLELILDDNTSNGISIEKAVPVSDSTGEKSIEYTFTVENKGMAEINYSLYFDDLNLDAGQTRIEDDKIRYKLVKDDNILTVDDISKIVFVEGNYTFSFNETTHKIVNVVNSAGETISGLGDAINNQLSENATLDDALTVVKRTLGQNYTYKTVSPRNSKLVSTMGANPNRILDSSSISKNQKYTYKLQVWIDRDAGTEIMGKIFYAKIKLTATQAKSSISTTLCKRATTLHTEICSNTDSATYCGGDGYTTGSEITYGNLGVKGTLTTGDAFDCDVNGDGVYDSTTERFYYVNDLDSTTANLIYYSNVIKGVPNNTTGVFYSSDYGILNPNVAMTELPKTSQWSNVSLKEKTKKILYSSNNEAATVTYDGYAARLMSSQEVESACNTSDYILSNKCKFMLENTEYSNSSLIDGYWLATIYNEYQADYIYGKDRRLSNILFKTGSMLGTRPVIEVSKTDMEY